MSNYNSQLAQSYGNSLNGVSYSGAQAYYRQLRTRFLQQAVELGEVKTQKEKMQQIEKILLETVNSVGRDNVRGKSRSMEVLNKIFDQFVSNMIDESSQLNQIKNEALQKINDEELDIKSQIAGEKEKVNAILKEYASAYKEIAQKTLLSILVGEHSGVGENAIKERYDALLKKVDMMTTIAIKAIGRDLKTYKLTGTPQTTLGGYIEEDLEFQGLQKLFSKLPAVTISPGGTKTAGKKNKSTHLDNIISVLEFSQKGFNDQILITENLEKYMNTKELLSNINYYGEQVKTFTLKNTVSSSKDFYGKRIANNAALFKKWTDSEQKTKYYKSLNIYRNIKFLAKTENTIAALGAETLLMSTSDGRYFTDEFISQFYKQEYYLMFAHSSLDDKWLPIIVLDKPWQVDKNKRHARKKVYSRYSDLV